jgi:hypothetical protein
MPRFYNQGYNPMGRRPANYHELSGEQQWMIDKELGVLDYDPGKTELPEREPVPFPTFTRRMKATTSVHERGAILMEAVRELAWRCGKVEETDELIQLYKEAPDA